MGSGTEGKAFDFKNVKAIIFDYGGTLDTDGRHWSHILREGYAACGVRLTDGQWREAYVYGERALSAGRTVTPRDNFRDVLLKKACKELDCMEERGFARFGRREREDVARRTADYCRRYASRHIAVSRAVLGKLSARYPLALVSNFYGNLNAVLDDFRLDFFKAVIESAAVGARKPDPAIFRLGIEALACKAAETLVVGDSYSKDIIPAASLGCPTVWVRGEGWGGAPGDTSLPEKVVTDLRQLLPLLV